MDILTNSSGGRVALTFMIIVACTGGILAAWASVTNHHNFGTTLFDLAVYDNVLWQTRHGRLLGSSLIPGGFHTGTHVDPVLVLLAPIYALAPRAETLLVFQAVWLAFGALPLFLLARRQLGNDWLALALGTSLLVHPALHGPMFYDFHSLSLAGPLLLWALHFLISGHRRAYVVVFVLLLLTREDMALLLIPVGMMAFALGERGLGRLTIAGALLYFAAVKLVLQLTSGGGGSFAFYYSDLVQDPNGNLGDLLIAVVLNPLKALIHALGGAQRHYLGIMFLPLLLLPFFARRGRFMMAYGLAATLLASRGAMHSVHFQYTTLIYPFAFALVPFAVLRLAPDLHRSRHQKLRAGLVVAVLVACTGAGIRFGALSPNDSFQAGYSEFKPYPDPAGKSMYAGLVRLRDRIPPDASVAASRHMGPHVSNRWTVGEFPLDSGADWLLLRQSDLHRKDPTGWQEKNLKLLGETGAYELVDQSEGGITLWRRNPDVALPDLLPAP